MTVTMCEKGGGMGGYGGTTGNSLPSNPSQTRHIFGDRPGHLPDTPRNRQILMEVANDPDCFVGRSLNGLDWYARIEPDGSQIWVKVYRGTVSDGGVNHTPRQYDLETGFNSNPYKKRRKR